MIGRGIGTVLLLSAICLLGMASVLAEEPRTPEEPAKSTEKSPQKTEDVQKSEGESGEEGEERKAEDARPGGLVEEVKVTATRRETKLMETPVAVTVIEQDDLDRQGIRNVRDMAQMVPNMDIATINGQSTPIISLRGVRSTNETELGDPAVGVHLDGIYSPRMQGMLGMMFDNERVEVLRGPQGTLFGRNSTVGSINIITAKPKLDKKETNFNLQYGNYAMAELQGIHNMPISDTFAMRFAGRYMKRDSYVNGYWDANQYDQRFVAGDVDGAAIIAPGSFDECTSPLCYTRTQKFNWWADDTGDPIRALVAADDDDFYMNAEEWAYRVSSLWKPNDRHSLTLTYQQFRSQSAGGVDLVNCEKLRGRPTYLLGDNNEPVLGDDGQPIVTGRNDCSTLFPEDDTYQVVTNVPGKFDLDILYLRSRYDYQIGKDLQLVVLAGFEDQDRESAQDMDQSLNAWDQGFYFLPGTGSQSWSGEIQLQSYGTKKFNWITGINYFRESTKTIGYFDNVIDEKAYFVQPDRGSIAGAVFGQGTYSFTDQWHLTLGYRYSDETKEDKNGRTYICNASNGCADGIIGTGQVDTVTGFLRDDINSVPTDFFDDPSVYPEFQQNDNKGSWTNNDWRIGIDWQKNADTLLYTYLATGFKAGGIGDVFEGTAITEGGIDDEGVPFVISQESLLLRTDYEPEQVTTLELGWKQRLAKGKAEIRAAYFYSDYEDMQYASVGSLATTLSPELVRDANGNPVDEDGIPGFDRQWTSVPLITAYFTQNVPGARIQGLELEYDWRPWRAGRIRGYGSWLDTEITEDWITKWDYDAVSYFGLNFDQAADAERPELQVNLKGNELAVSPNFKVNVTLDHAFFLPRAQMSIVPWVTVHWESDSYLTIWNVDKHTDDMDFVIRDEDIRYTDDKREAWSMVHLGARLYTGAFTAEVYMYNATDEVVQWWGGAAEQVPKGSMSMPRNYGIRLGYTF